MYGYLTNPKKCSHSIFSHDKKIRPYIPDDDTTWGCNGCSLYPKYRNEYYIEKYIDAWSDDHNIPKLLLVSWHIHIEAVISWPDMYEITTYKYAEWKRTIFKTAS